MTQELCAMMHIDEWGFSSEKSRIDECQIEPEGGLPIKTTKNDILPDSTIKAETKKIKIKPGLSARLTSTGIEIRRPNDDISFVFLAPTLNPTIDVDVPNNFSFESEYACEEFDIVH